MATAGVDTWQHWHELSLAFDNVGPRDSGVDTGFIDDRGMEGREEGNGTLQFLFAIREKGPVGPIAPVSNVRRNR